MKIIQNKPQNVRPQVVEDQTFTCRSPHFQAKLRYNITVANEVKTMVLVLLEIIAIFVLVEVSGFTWLRNEKEIREFHE